MTPDIDAISRRSSKLPPGIFRDQAERYLAQAEGLLLSAVAMCEQGEQLAELRRDIDQILDEHGRQ